MQIVGPYPGNKQYALYATGIWLVSKIMIATMSSQWPSTYKIFLVVGNGLVRVLMFLLLIIIIPDAFWPHQVQRTNRSHAAPYN